MALHLPCCCNHTSHFHCSPGYEEVIDWCMSAADCIYTCFDVDCDREPLRMLFTASNIELLVESQSLKAIYPFVHPASTVVGAWWAELVSGVSASPDKRMASWMNSM